jgi:hypothetical protein
MIVPHPDKVPGQWREIAPGKIMFRPPPKDGVEPPTPSTLPWGRELHEVIQEAKKMASQIQQSSDLWDLEHYLTERRNRDRPQIRLSSIRDLQMCWGDF